MEQKLSFIIDKKSTLFYKVQQIIQMESHNSKVINQIEALYEARAKPDSQPGSNQILNDANLEAMIKAMSSIQNSQKLVEFARKIQINDQNFEYLVGQLSLSSTGEDQHRKHLLVIIVSTHLRLIKEDIAQQWQDQIVKAVSGVVISGPSEELLKETEQLLLTLNSASATAKISGVNIERLSQQAFEFLIHLALTKGNQWQEGLLQSESFCHRLIQGGMKSDHASLILLEKVVGSQKFESLLEHLVDQLEAQISEGQLRVLLKFMEKKGKEVAELIVQKKLIQTVIDQIIHEDNSTNKRLLLFLLIRLVLESIKTVDREVASAFVNLLVLYNTEIHVLQGVSLSFAQKLVGITSQLPFIRNEVDSFIIGLASKFSSSCEDQSNQQLAKSLRQNSHLLTKYLRLSTPAQFDRLLSEGLLLQQIVSLLSALQQNGLDSNTRSILICINLLDALLKTNARHKHDKLENNKLLEGANALDRIEDLQNHKDRRLRDAAFRLIDGNLVPEDEK